MFRVESLEQPQDSEEVFKAVAGPAVGQVPSYAREKDEAVVLT